MYARILDKEKQKKKPYFLCEVYVGCENRMLFQPYVILIHLHHTAFFGKCGDEQWQIRDFP